MSDDRMKTQSDEFDALANLVMLAVARYIANPGAYYKAYYERMREDGSAT